MYKVVYKITRECFVTDKKYKRFLQLVEEEKSLNNKIETVKMNPLDKILERRNQQWMRN